MKSQLARYVSARSQIILAGSAITGLFTTAYLASTATLRARDILWVAEQGEVKASGRLDKKTSFSAKFKLCWKEYIPAAIVATATVASIVTGVKIMNTRLATAASMAIAGERLFDDYKRHVVEAIGESKEQKIRDAVVQDRINQTPAHTIIIQSGSVLCCELLTMRYFESNKDELLRGVNLLNKKVLAQDEAYLDDFYEIVGLPFTTMSNQVGWESDKLMDLTFTSALSPDGKPCLAFDYNYTRLLKTPVR
jgi:hypothetical protein